MQVWVFVVEFLALLGLTGCGAQEEEEVVELTFDDIIGGNESWDESEIYEEARTNEDRQGERATSEALVSCTSALSESETVKMAATGNEILADISQLNKNDISREAPFSGCRLSPDKKCTLDTSYIEGGAWQDYDENYDMGTGKNALDCDRSYMFCQYGHGIIYLKDAGQTFKDQVEEKAEDELLITLDILQGMVVYDDGGDAGKRTEVNRIKLGVKEIDTYDFESQIPVYKPTRELRQEDVDEINRVLYKYEINTPDRAAHFLAQCTAESKLGNGPVETFNGGDIFAYFANRDHDADLGNSHYKDGAIFRGAGAIHMTGRDAYTEFQTYMEEHGVSDDNIVNHGAVCVGKYYFWESAGYYWHVYKNINSIYFSDGKEASVRTITEKVNGGRGQLEVREQAYLHLIQALEGGN